VGVVLYEMLIGRLPFSSKTAELAQDYKGLFEKIIKEDIRLPADLSLESRTLLLQLLEKDPAKRLGSSVHDFEEIKSHEFFATIDWVKLTNRQLQVPFKPVIVSEIDTSYFEKEFTCENIQLTPPLRKAATPKLYEIKNYFDSFSYYGSRTSLNSQLSHSSMKLPGCCSPVAGGGSNVHHKKSEQTDKYDANSILNECKQKKKNLLSSSSSSSSSDSSLFLACNAFPNIINFTSSKQYSLFSSSVSLSPLLSITGPAGAMHESQNVIGADDDDQHHPMEE
jgi:serine/threonine protein kinase